eukprot:Rmarinus@m.2149
MTLDLYSQGSFFHGCLNEDVARLPGMQGVHLGSYKSFSQKSLNGASSTFSISCYFANNFSNESQDQIDSKYDDAVSSKNVDNLTEDLTEEQEYTHRCTVCDILLTETGKDDHRLPVSTMHHTIEHLDHPIPCSGREVHPCEDSNVPAWTCQLSDVECPDATIATAEVPTADSIVRRPTRINFSVQCGQDSTAFVGRKEEVQNRKRTSTECLEPADPKRARVTPTNVHVNSERLETTCGGPFVGHPTLRIPACGDVPHNVIVPHNNFVVATSIQGHFLPEPGVALQGVPSNQMDALSSPAGEFAQQNLSASQGGEFLFPNQTTVIPTPVGGFTQQDLSISQGGGLGAQQDTLSYRMSERSTWDSSTGGTATQAMIYKGPVSSHTFGGIPHSIAFNLSTALEAQAKGGGDGERGLTCDAGKSQCAARQAPISTEKTSACKMGDYTYFDEERQKYVLCDDYRREFSGWKNNNKYRWGWEGDLLVVTTLAYEDCAPTTSVSNARGLYQTVSVLGRTTPAAVRIGWKMTGANLRRFLDLDDAEKDFIVFKYLRHDYQKSISQMKSGLGGQQAPNTQSSRPKTKAVGSPTPQARCPDARFASHPAPHPVSAHNSTIEEQAAAVVPSSFLPRDTHSPSSPLHPPVTPTPYTKILADFSNLPGEHQIYMLSLFAQLMRSISDLHNRASL